MYVNIRSVAGHSAIVAHSPVYRAPFAAYGHAAATVEIYVSCNNKSV